MEKTYTLFGDSIAKGIIIENNKPKMMPTNAVKILEEYYNIKINNKSCYGQTLSRCIEKNMIENYINSLDKTKKNIAIIELGGNDADYDWPAVAENCDNSNNPKTLEQDFYNKLDSTVKKLMQNGVEVWIVTLPPINSELYFKNIICNLTDGEKIMRYFKGDLSNIARHQSLYNEMIIKVAVANNAKLLDIRMPFLMLKNCFSLYANDGIHPNEEGHALIANTIIDIFGKKI